MPAALTAADARRALQGALRDAQAAYERNDRDLDGHYRSAVRVVAGRRISVRYNRHERRQIVLSYAQRPLAAIDRNDITILSEAHRELTGSALRIAFTGPAHGREDEDLHWVVLGIQDESTQPRLM